jgi:hypothetical protein
MSALRRFFRWDYCFRYKLQEGVDVMKNLSKILCAAVLITAFCVTALDAQTARFESIQGTVEVKQLGRTDWVPAASGMSIEKATVISTGFKSSAVVTLGESTLQIRALTRLSLDEILAREGSNTVELFMQTGRVKADVKPPESGKVDFTIKTPSVTASVRGTMFEMDTNNLKVNEGAVHFAATTESRKGSVSGSAATTTAATTTTAVALVRAGETSFVDTVTNTAASPREQVRESFTPTLPAGTESGGGSTVPTIPAAPIAPPTTGTTEITLNW